MSNKPKLTTSFNEAVMSSLIRGKLSQIEKELLPTPIWDDSFAFKCTLFKVAFDLIANPEVEISDSDVAAVLADPPQATDEDYK